MPIISLVNNYILSAVLQKASDIHFEPNEKFLLVRFRIDGRLQEVGREPINSHSSIVARIKVLGNIDLAEPKKYTDGRFPFSVENKRYDIRFSIFPTIFGDVAVLRVLNTSAIELGLDPLGMSSEQLDIFKEVINEPYGMVLVTGPNGSGKTTTLYSALSTINSFEKSIATLEDPVEYQLPLLRQSQIDVDRGITFAKGLRALLRQDPDVIMVGEIRDLDTAKIAVQAAMTGHLVFSTLHTNNSIGALIRLMNMGVETFLVAYATLGVIAQRLVRIICDECKEQYQPDPAFLKKFGLPEKTILYRGRGCDACNQTGFSGRTGIYEILKVDQELRHSLFQNASLDDVYEQARKSGMKTLREHGLEKALQGTTTIEEVLSITEGGL